MPRRKQRGVHEYVSPHARAVRMHRDGLAEILGRPREGTTDLRGKTAGLLGGKESRTGVSPYLAGSADHRQKNGTDVWAGFRNGLPEPARYLWRAPGWEDRARKAGLDLAAIAEADWELFPQEEPSV